MTTANLLDFDLEGLAAFCATLGEKRFRAVQLFRWIHQKGEADFARMSDLAKSLRDKLAADGAEPVGNAPAEFTRHIRAELERWLDPINGTGQAGVMVDRVLARQG